MAISEFPQDSVSSAYPRTHHFTAQQPKFKGASVVFDDGGVDAALQYGGNGTLVWELEYNGLTRIQVAPIDSHHAASKWLEDEGMSAETFNYRDRDSGILYSGVRYTKFEASHTKVDIQRRVIQLTKFP